MKNANNQSETVFYAAATITAFAAGTLATYWAQAKLAGVNPEMANTFKDFAFAGLKKVLEGQK